MQEKRENELLLLGEEEVEEAVVEATVAVPVCTQVSLSTKRLLPPCRRRSIYKRVRDQVNTEDGENQEHHPVHDIPSSTDSD